MNKSYQNSFRPAIWQNLSLDQRVLALQELENDFAAQSRRTSCLVKPAQMPSLSHCGVFLEKDKIIEVNREHVSLDFFMCTAIQTVLHEGRHAYQAAAIKRGLHPNQEEVTLWRVNKAVYFQDMENGFPAYRFQPVERDADDFAIREIKEIFQRLERDYGQIDLFRKYRDYLSSESKMAVCAAKNAYGENYRAEIDEWIKLEYKKQQLDKSQAYKIEVKLDGRDWVSKNVMVEKSDDLQDKLAAQARCFALSEAYRLRIDPDSLRNAVIKVNRIPLEEYYQKECRPKDLEHDRGVKL